MRLLSRIRSVVQAKREAKKKKAKRRAFHVQQYELRPELAEARYMLLPHHYRAKTSEGIRFSKIAKFGKPFIGAFPTMEISSPKKSFTVKISSSPYESPIAIRIVPLPAGVPIASAKLAFSRNAVLIETIQGSKGRIKDLKRFEAVVGMPWPNFLVKKIMAVARRAGYSEVRLRDPTTLSYFKAPAGVGGMASDRGITREYAENVIRANMMNLYTKIRDALGFKPRMGSKYWVKKL